MLRSLFSGISGLRAHQMMMDVVGNNIANVNSLGYKSSNVVFEDTLSQFVRNSGSSQGGTAGVNAAQVGLGVKIAGISTNFNQGAAQLTGRSTDLMIQGDGFFVVNDGTQELYTRAGSLTLDATGNLATPDGAIVQGWTAANGVINSNAAPSDIQLPMGTLLAPVATTTMSLGGNVPADAGVGTALVTTITTYDGQGNAVPVTATLTKTGAEAWDMALTNATPATVALTFNAATGALVTASPVGVTIGGNALSIDISQLSQYGAGNTLAALSQDGSAMGTLQGMSLSADGTLVGVFSNGLKQNLAQIAMASFNNPGGLEKVGNSSFRTSVNSGNAQIGVAGSSGRGMLAGGALEMSNVDLAAEFTNLIVAQRGFQANSRVITASDEILQDLVNIKR